jgi:hypothetical protein
MPVTPGVVALGFACMVTWNVRRPQVSGPAAGRRQCKWWSPFPDDLFQPLMQRGSHATGTLSFGSNSGGNDKITAAVRHFRSGVPCCRWWLYKRLVTACCDRAVLVCAGTVALRRRRMSYRQGPPVSGALRRQQIRRNREQQHADATEALTLCAVTGVK